MSRKPYPTDVSDDEWNFVAPYLTLMNQDAPQREYPLREVFNALRYMARGGEAWRMLPHDFPPWQVVYQQTRRWFNAGVFETMVHDLRAILRLCEGRNPDPAAAVIDSRTLQSTPESGRRCGYDGAKKKKGSKVHAAATALFLSHRDTDNDCMKRYYVQRDHARLEVTLRELDRRLMWQASGAPMLPKKCRDLTKALRSRWVQNASD
jgi:transposase